MGRTFRFEDVAEALPELATDVDEVRGVEDLRVHSCVRVEIVRFVFHVVKLSDFFAFVNGFFDFFSADFQPLENVLRVRQHLVHLFVTELAPLGLSDLVVLELVEVDLVLVSHAQRLDDFSDTVKHFSDIFFWRLRLTTGLESRKKAYKKEKFFCKKSLTRPNLPEYNGVSQGDTPLPP